MNNENFTHESVKDMPLIGVLDNRWRQRHVTVHPHPDKPTMVISVGRPYNGGESVVCVEPRQDYERVIAAFPRTVVYN